MSSIKPLISPWHPIQEPVALKHLGKLLEELGELTAATARCVIQGPEESEPVTGKPNRLWLQEEIADVRANIRLVVKYLGLDEAFMDEREDRKVEQLKSWHDMA